MCILIFAWFKQSIREKRKECHRRCYRQCLVCDRAHVEEHGLLDVVRPHAADYLGSVRKEFGHHQSNRGIFLCWE